MNSNITSLLRIPGFFVTDVQIDKEEIIISARKRSKTAHCPFCNKRSKRLHDYLRIQKVLHMSLSLQKVYLMFRKRRFRCDNCCKTFTESISFLQKRSRKSIFVQIEALDRLSDSSFRKTTERVGISYGGMVSLLKRVFTLETINWQEQKVKDVIRIGIDEHHFGKKNKYLITIANLLTGKPIHILPDDKQKTLTTFLKHLPEEVKDRIEEVAVDMRRSFIAAVAKELPKARIVIDHFHLIQDANKRVNEARRIEDDVEEKIRGNGPRRIPFKLLMKNKEELKGEQDKLVRYYLHLFPAVAIFYSCKERLRDMYKSQTKEEAETILNELIRSMRTSQYPELWSWAKTLNGYHDYILNYFNNHTTNAVTEGLHRKFKLIQRTAYGFRNPEVYARRIMLACLPLSFILTKLPH
jgi:transposase